MRISPKKRLGQHFLVCKNIQKKIIDACCFTDNDIVCEIGAGFGVLTPLIAERVKKVYALEIDPALCEQLEKVKETHPNIEIVMQDILRFNFENLFSGHSRKVKVVGNIPYYISTPILERLFTFRKIIASAALTVQKEFARRVVAQPGSKEYGSLSCFARYYCEPSILFYIKSACFKPAPKVDSAFIRLTIRDQPEPAVGDEAFFFKVMRTAFTYRRKTLRKSLEGIVSPEALDTFFTRESLNRNIRPEMLSLLDFKKLSDSEKMQKNS